jgi:hypothetical protein
MKQGSPALSVAILFGASYLAYAQRPPVNRHAQITADFESRLRRYVKIHQQAEGRLKLPALKPTANPAKIHGFERSLGQAIRTARRNTKQHEIFTPVISAEFKRLIGTAFDGPESHRVRVSLKHDEPVNARLHVNESYPEAIPLQTTPPSLLLDLPKLPPELEYRVVGRDLVLRDVKANLVVDFIPKALP